MLEQLLTQLGLNQKEQLLYKLILERGKITPTLLSRLSKINRTTIYSVGKELVQKGLIVEDLGGKTMYYTPAQETEIERALTKEKALLKEKERAILELKELLKNNPGSTTYSVPKIRFIDEADLESYLFEAVPRWIENQLQVDRTWWGFQDHTFAEQFEKWIVWFWKKAPEAINLKLFSNDSAIETRMQDHAIERRQIRFWKGESDLTSTQWIVGDYILSIVTKEKPYYLVEIHDAVMAHNMREVFKKLWESEK